MLSTGLTLLLPLAGIAAERVTPQAEPSTLQRSASRVPDGGRSALRSGAPDDFAPIQRDLARHPRLAALVGDNALLGVYLPDEQAGRAADTGPTRTMLAVEDLQFGGRPVHAAEFERHKIVLRAAFDVDTLARRSQRLLATGCDDATHLCFDTERLDPARPDGRPAGYLRTLFLLVGGRIVIVYALGDGPAVDNLEFARHAAGALADEIVRLNP